MMQVIHEINHLKRRSHRQRRALDQYKFIFHGTGTIGGGQ